MKPNILISTGGGDAANYIAAIEAAGGQAEARYLPAPELTCDGLLLAGGEDMDPALFGQADRGSRGIDRTRDEAELALLDLFLGAGRPVLAICRGHQVVNVWLGGPVFPVNSWHHQALGRLGKGLSASARSKDGVVEAVEHHSFPLISVQFHPERMTGAKARPDTVDGGAVFRAFLDMAGKS